MIHIFFIAVTSSCIIAFNYLSIIKEFCYPVYGGDLKWFVYSLNNETERMAFCHHQFYENDVSSVPDY